MVFDIIDSIKIKESLMKQKMYIPEKLMVGFQKRSDTMTGKLSYITYMKDKKIYKERSWKNWSSNDIPKENHDNKPLSGFLVSKDVTHYSYSYYSRGSQRTKMRIFDPRGFDFEISINNLTFIIETCNINNGEIEGEFIYAWDGTELILIPTKTTEYKESIEFSENELKKIAVKDLVVGATYQTKKVEHEVVYLGRFDYFKNGRYSRSNTSKDICHAERQYGDDIYIPFDFYEGKGKKHVFFNRSKRNYEVQITNQLSICLDSDIADDYDELLEKYMHSPLGSKIVGFKSDKDVAFQTIKKNRCEYAFKKLDTDIYLSFSFSENSFSSHSKKGYKNIDEISIIKFNKEFGAFVDITDHFYYESRSFCSYYVSNKDNEKITSIFQSLKESFSIDDDTFINLILNKNLSRLNKTREKIKTKSLLLLFILGFSKENEKHMEDILDSRLQSIYVRPELLYSRMKTIKAYKGDFILENKTSCSADSFR